MHVPTYKKHDGTDCIVIFIHGFMGSPDQFEDLAEAVHKIGCAHMSVLLPGHGASVKEFARFGIKDWQRHVQKEINKVKHEYKKIFLVGHSMGGLLALNASLIKGSNISGVVLISTPLKINWLHPKFLWLKLCLELFPKDNEIKAAYIKAKSIGNSELLLYPLTIKPIFSFFKLTRQTGKRLPGISVPVYMFHSKNDETVSFKSAGLLYKGLRNTKRTAITLDKSWHAFYYGDEREIIKTKLIEFIQQFR